MTKYHAKPVDADGYHFDSTAEYNHYIELKLRFAAHEISVLRVHPKYPIMVNGMKVCDYEPDFTYVDRETGLTVVEDVKGVKTPVYRLKKKLMQAVYNIDITEVTNSFRIPSGRLTRRGLERA